MARRFNYRRVKIHRTYTIAELAARIGAHKQTVGRWIAAGLPTTDSTRPFLPPSRMLTSSRIKKHDQTQRRK
jgi:hypothetical protein